MPIELVKIQARLAGDDATDIVVESPETNIAMDDSTSDKESEECKAYEKKATKMEGGEIITRRSKVTQKLLEDRPERLRR